MNDIYLSLYDYLGRPAGSTLGQQVYAVARENGVRVDTREVVTSRYKGKVLLYPRNFLVTYFKTVNK